MLPEWLVVESFEELPCVLKTFTIKGKEASLLSFGRVTDVDEDVDNPNLCKNMIFIPHYVCTKSVREQYDLTIPEYCLVLRALTNLLTIGSCKRHVTKKV